ncbi:Pyruvate/Phosphoenolpyruvate kinase-like domain-containing protein [Filobasidium floriforme]|uniref:Pyruvate/Phosphoenolpyruvate kinase-like domain-containing protein n=1 Tax=Filobasidium floriforme TaxID=5210 RepID=UPI001E8D3EFF|nr:Pyruvate/Phosphoenolpyruvate kinase-like domain-containing protein [Filobasidium floriforme]KAH8080541.1 Pyruvate/Phosphoenolpyruvate kinase-like domain-containing protein [Filobasidium floriforme]
MITPIIRHTGSKLLGQQRLAGSTRIANLNTSSPQIPVGSLLYVPASSDKFLQKSLGSDSSTIVYDLEDSVHETAKDSARERLSKFLQDLPQNLPNRPLNGTSVAVRPNNPWTGSEAGAVTSESFYEDPGNYSGGGPLDLAEIWGHAKEPGGRTLPMMLMPKVESAGMLDALGNLSSNRGRKIPLIASIESPGALMRLGEIAAWRGQNLELVGLLFAAEDFCASSGIIRTRSRMELLHARSSVVIAAKAYGLSAIDMVCVDYKDMCILREESEEGRRLGFTAKQAIHPSQVETILNAYAPSAKDIARAQQILDIMSSSKRGAEGLKSEDGREEMIDRPMVLQAERTIREATAAGRLQPRPPAGTRAYSTARPSAPRKSCPNCGEALALQVTPCTACRTPCPLPSDILHHALFDLVPEASMSKPAKEILEELPGGGFDIDSRGIRMTFLKKQQRIHPDSFSGAGEKEHALAIDQSSHFNKAYTTLLNPLSRAKYLLDQYGYDIAESDSLTDPELLMEVMEAREELEEASTQEECDAVRESNRVKSEQVVQNILEVFSSSSVDLERAKGLTIELQYLQNLDNAAKEWQPGKRVEITH